MIPSTAKPVFCKLCHREIPLSEMRLYTNDGEPFCEICAIKMGILTGPLTEGKEEGR